MPGGEVQGQDGLEEEGQGRRKRGSLGRRAKRPRIPALSQTPARRRVLRSSRSRRRPARRSRGRVR